MLHVARALRVAADEGADRCKLRTLCALERAERVSFNMGCLLCGLCAVPGVRGAAINAPRAAVRRRGVPSHTGSRVSTEL